MRWIMQADFGAQQNPIFVDYVCHKILKIFSWYT